MQATFQRGQISIDSMFTCTKATWSVVGYLLCAHPGRVLGSGCGEGEAWVNWSEREGEGNRCEERTQIIFADRNQISSYGRPHKVHQNIFRLDSMQSGKCPIFAEVDLDLNTDQIFGQINVVIYSTCFTNTLRACSVQVDLKGIERDWGRLNPLQVKIPSNPRQSPWEKV